MVALRRQAVWLFGSAALVIAFAAIRTALQSPIYEVRTTLRIEEKSTAAPDLFTALTAPSTVETEMEILRSRTVMQHVVDSLSLHVSVTEPKGAQRNALFALVRTSDNPTLGIYEVRREAGGFSVTTPGGRRLEGTYGAPLDAEGLTVEPLPWEPGAPERIRLSVAPMSRAAAGLREALSVTRPQPNAAIVSVAYRSSDPILARDVANAVAQSYISLRNEMQKHQARTAVLFLESQIQTIGGQLGEAEGALKQFRRARVVVDPTAQGSEQVRRLAELRAQREAVALEESALRALLERADTKDEKPGSPRWLTLAASPALAKNEAISSTLQQLAELETERSRLLARRTPQDPDVRSLGETLQLLEGRLGKLVDNQLLALEERARSLDTALSQFDSEVRGIPEVELDYARLRRQVDLLSQLYTLLQTRLKEAQISEAVEVANVQVIDPAIVPTAPLQPRRQTNLLLGVVAGLILGAGVALAREMTDTRIRSREEVVKLTELPLLAAIPRIAGADGRRPGEVAERIEARLVTRHSPRSPSAEAYRALRTNIAFSGAARDLPIKTIVFTSAEPQDGKTTTAANLAVTLAEQGLRVLLLEADQRRPLLHRVFHVDRKPGLTDVLAGNGTAELATRRIPLPDYAVGTLDFMPGGTVVPNPAELVGSLKMKALLLELAKQYDTVVLDTPPLTMVTDAAVAGTIVDGVIVVARMGSTHRTSLRRAVEELEGVGARLLGIVLNDVHHTEDRYGYRYAYAYTYHDEDGTDGAGDRDGKPAARGERVRGTRVLPAIWAAMVGANLVLTGSPASAQTERRPPPERTSASAAGLDTSLTYGVRPGDVVRVWIWREPDLSGEFPIDPRGTVILPLLGALEAAGKTGETLAEELRSAYARYLKNPSVQVTVLRRVAVQGLVAKPGFYPVDATVSIGEVIALAGGIAPSGDPGRIRLVRAGRVVVTRLGPETVLERSSVQSGDVIFVPEKGWLARNGGTLLWAGVSVAGAVLVGTLVR